MPPQTVYILFALGGVAALIYEVLWMRSFRLVFGSSTYAAAVVLAAFFGGMALGNLLGGRLARRGRPIRLYGFAEIAVGLTALLVEGWLALYQGAYHHLYSATGGSALWLGLGRGALAFLALAPPAIAMGMTLPLLVRAVVSREDHLARRSTLLYALNIAGAVVGVFLAGFVLPASLGISNSIYVAVGLNLVIGAVALSVREGRAPEGQPAKSDASADVRPEQHRPSVGLLALAAGSGFGCLALEVVCVRLLSQYTEGSVYSFALMLATFLVFLSLGAGVVAIWGDRINLWRLLAWTQLIAVVGILVAPVLFQFIPLLTGFSPRDALGERTARFAAGCAVILGPPVLLIGVVLPCAWKIAGRRISRIGAQVGALTAVNTLAAVAGSLIAGFILLPWLGPGGSTLLIAAVYALVAISGFRSGYGGLRRWAGGLACVALAISWYLLGAWRISIQSLDPGESLISSRDGAAATVAVIRLPNGHRVLKMNGKYVLGSTSALGREVRQGRLPLMLHPHPERVALIGVGTGMTVSAAKDFPVRRVVAIELVPGVMEALPHFEHWNRSIFNDPRVELIVEDGRNYLLGTPDQFDVIISDLFVPWHAGTGDLYAVEHFRTARGRLAEGGLFAQWLPGYQLTVDELRTVVASFLEVFPAATLWQNDFDAKLPVLCLVGYRDALAIDASAVLAACKRLSGKRRPPAPLLSSPEGLTMLYVCGDAALRHWADDAPLNTDDRPRIENSAPQSAFVPTERLAAATHELLAQLQSRRWCYDEALIEQKRIAEVFNAADLLREANRAMLRSNFEQEFRYLKELVDLASDVPAVAVHITKVAGRYRRRNMPDRSEVLLSALVEHPDPPVGALVALADARRGRNDQAGAIALLQRAVERVPEYTAIRQRLLEMLQEAEQFEQAEPHLRRLVDAEPNNPYLRLDLARALHRQKKTEEAAREVAEFRKRWDGRDPKRVWLYLRRLDLGSYVDTVPKSPLPRTPAPRS